MKKYLVIYILLLWSITIKSQTIQLDSTILNYKIILDSTQVQKAWDVDWGFDNKLWITDFRNIKRWNPVNNELDTIWTSSYGNYLGLHVPKSYIGDTLNFYAVLDTHPIYYKAGFLAHLYKYTYLISQDSVIENEIIYTYPHGGEHSGGRVDVRNNQEIFLTTAEYWVPNLNIELGNIIRLRPDGSLFEDNCSFGKYSFGHRNPQGLEIVPNGNVFISEHGQLLNGDEINLIEKCKHYGWPHFDGIECLSLSDSCNSETFLENYKAPALYGFEKLGPPAGMTFYNHQSIPEFQNSLLIGLLHSGNYLTIARLNNSMDSLIEVDKIETPFLRKRDICAAPDGSIYLIGFDRSWNQQVGQYCKIFKLWNPDFTSSNLSLENSHSYLSVFPNPSKGYINIKNLKNIKSFDLAFIDSDGKIIQRIKELNRSYNFINYSGRMIYLIGTINGQNYSKKIIVF